jgi:hypothetical protein
MLWGHMAVAFVVRINISIARRRYAEGTTHAEPYPTSQVFLLVNGARPLALLRYNARVRTASLQARDVTLDGRNARWTESQMDGTPSLQTPQAHKDAEDHGRGIS